MPISEFDDETGEETPPTQGEDSSSAHKDRGHALCSASSASRWLNCPGSTHLITLAPKQKSSAYAEEGTLAHEFSERFLNAWLKEKDYTAKNIEPEMYKNVISYIYYVKAKSLEFNQTPNIRIEQKLLFDEDLSMWGTADVAMTGVIGGELHGKIIDLKYGKGKVVAKDNPQLAYYAVALRKTSKYDLESVEVCIFQPKLSNPVTSVWYTREELDAWYNKLYTGAERSLWGLVDSSKRIYKMGDWCKWCPAKGICPEMNQPAPEGAGTEFF